MAIRKRRDERRVSSDRVAPLQTTKDSRPEHEIALDLIGFVHDRLVAQAPVDFDSLVANLDESVPGWSENRYGALRGAVHLACSERDRVSETRSDGEEIVRRQKTATALSALYTGTRARQLLSH